MNRPLLVLNAVLALAFAALWSADRFLERAAATKRWQASVLRGLGDAALALEQVARVELSIRGGEEAWTYERRPEGWRIPRYRDAFALSQNLEGILKVFIDGRGTRVGHFPEGAAHFGLTPEDTLRVDLHDGRGRRLLGAVAGIVAPGQRSTECFATADGDAAILQLHANPWPYFDWTPASTFPPLTDRRVIPLALGRSSIARVQIRGTGAGVHTLIRKEIPLERRPMGPDRGPRFEWFGTLADEPDERRVNDSAAFAYIAAASGLEFDELLGDRTRHEAAFARPVLTLTFHYDGDARDDLVLGTPASAGRRHLLNASTGQVFAISAERAQSLTPDTTALLRPNPPPLRTSPQTPAIPGLTPPELRDETEE